MLKRHKATHVLNRHGDYETTFEEWAVEIPQLHKTRASQLGKKELWAEGLRGQEEEGLLKDRITNAYDDIFSSPLRGSKKKSKIHAKAGHAGKGPGWRQYEKILSHQVFQNEPDSWKGSDVGLIKLNASFYGKRAKGSVAPACLASAGHDMEKHRKHTYFAGFGRRFVPYCFTDDQGPDSQGVCGWPDTCYPKTAQCGLEFLYQGQKHKKCLKDVDTPSMSDPVCSSLLESLPELEGEKKRMHVFESGNYVTTCYPRRAKDRGWCTTKDPWSLQHVEPEPNKGWGFCRDSNDQVRCDGLINSTANPTAFRVETLTNKYCVDELGANLKVEQSHVEREEFENLDEEHGVFCVADNHTHIYADDLYLERLENGQFQKREASETYISILRQNSTTKPHDINGRICYGDSGGPLFQLVYDSANDVVIPVIVGIFSFILWDPCHGRHEPAYMGKVQFLEDWIRRYVPEEETCWVGKDGKINYKTDKKL